MFSLIGLASFYGLRFVFSVITDEDIVFKREVRKDRMEAKTMGSSDGDSRIKKKEQGRRSSLDSPMPDKACFASTPAAPEVGKDGVKGKVMDFVKIFSQGAAGGEALGKSSRWRAKEVPVTDTSKDGAKAKETVKVTTDQQKKSNPVTPAMVCVSANEDCPLCFTVVFDSLCIISFLQDQDQDQKPSQATQKKVPDNSSKPSVVTEQEEKQEPSTGRLILVWCI